MQVLLQMFRDTVCVLKGLDENLLQNGLDDLNAIKAQTKKKSARAKSGLKGGWDSVAKVFFSSTHRRAEWC